MQRAASWLLCGALLAGCGQPQTEIEKANKKQILLFGNAAEPQDLDPQVITGVPEDNIMRALFEGLVSEDPQDLHPTPGTAESWEISADQTVYTFYLRHNAKWTDGTPITADDFIQSYKRQLSPALAAEYQYMLFVAKNAEAYAKGELKNFDEVGFKALDEHTLRITLHSPTPYFLSLLNHYSWFPVPIKTILKFGAFDQRGTRWTRPGNIVTNGPFRLKAWKTNQIIIVEKNPQYWDTAAVKLNEIHFFPIENASTEERTFRSGQLHLSYDIPVSKIEGYKRDHPEFLRIDPYLGSYFYRINVTRPVLKDKRVRQALSLAIDRDAIVTRVTKAGERPGTSLCPPGTAGYEPLVSLKMDLPAAKKLLAEAGFPNGKGFPFFEVVYNNDESHRVVAEAVQEMWKKNLGINIQITNQEWKVYLDTMRQLGYEICRAAWIGDYVDPNSFMDLFVTGGGNNLTGWSNAEYDRLVMEASQTGDLQKRLATFQKAEAILLDEMPIIPIYFYTRRYLLQPCVKGWYPTILDHHPYKYVWLE